jgi:hypothetical protein
MRRYPPIGTVDRAGLGRVAVLGAGRYMATFALGFLAAMALLGRQGRAMLEQSCGRAL